MSKIEEPGTAVRRHRLSVLATAPTAQLLELWSAWCAQNGAPAHEFVRAPEIGTVMVRGRAGAVGAPFNLGEITVTRASVRLSTGAIGHGYVQGRSKEAAQAAALIDALAESGRAESGRAESGGAETIDADIIAPISDALAGKRAARATKAAATKVEFFTMVRGDN